MSYTHHCEDKTWFLDTLGLHHLEHIHHTLSLAAINGGSYGTEHPRPADTVTRNTRERMSIERFYNNVSIMHGIK